MDKSHTEIEKVIEQENIEFDNEKFGRRNRFGIRFTWEAISENSEYKDRVLISDLNIFEATCLLAYSGFSSTILNESICKNTLLESQVAFIEGLDNALSKLKKHNNFLVYRRDDSCGCDLNNAEKFFKEQKRKVIQIPWYLSTFKDDLDDEKEIIEWRIQTNNNSKGRDISPLANAGSFENEVLFERDASFLVSAIIRENYKLVIVLNEVEKSNSSLIITRCYY